MQAAAIARRSPPAAETHLTSQTAKGNTAFDDPYLVFIEWSVEVGAHGLIYGQTAAIAGDTATGARVSITARPYVCTYERKCPLVAHLTSTLYLPILLVGSPDCNDWRHS